MPRIPEGFLETLPTNYRHLRYGFGVTQTEPEKVKLGRELYWAFVNWLDDEIGTLLESLAGSAVAENTVVVYTSDHGENKGDHGLWWKNNMYEHAARVPLIVSWPARWSGGQRRTGACSLVDLVQTLAELAGAPTPEDWDGESMLAWMDDPGSPWKDQAVSEYYGHNIASGFVMLRQGPWKYVYHTRMDAEHGPERELYHLGDDPGEFRNLAGRSEHARRIAAMHAALVRELGRDPEEAEAECRADYARGYAEEAAR
jgi:choline-sulfatase